MITIPENRVFVNRPKTFFHPEESMQKQGLNRTQMKLIAIFAMVLDHTAMFLLSPKTYPELFGLYAMMRTIGRLTGPTMFFFLAEGFRYTSSRRKYALRLLVFGLISQIPYALVHRHGLLDPELNVILTLFVAFLILEVSERIENRGLNLLVVFGLMLMTTPFDWGLVGPLLAWFFWRHADNRPLQRRFYAFVCVLMTVMPCLHYLQIGEPWYLEIWQLGMFLFLPFLSLYNGEAGQGGFVGRWLFYLFYPVHLLVIWLILGLPH